jgi:hypothetical protein
LLERLKTTTNRNKAVTANDKGENIMQQADNIQLVPKVSTIVDRVVHFFDRSRFSTPQPDQVMTNIDWPDSDSKLPDCGSDNQPVSGGYNEAFIVQYWTSYHLR